jgi:hypothetical protein
MDNEKPLSSAVEGLYHAFARYPFRKHVEGCPCCVHQQDKKAFHERERLLTVGRFFRRATRRATDFVARFILGGGAREAVDLLVKHVTLGV